MVFLNIFLGLVAACMFAMFVVGLIHAFKGVGRSNEMDYQDSKDLVILNSNLPTVRRRNNPCSVEKPPLKMIEHDSGRTEHGRS